MNLQMLFELCAIGAAGVPTSNAAVTLESEQPASVVEPALDTEGTASAGAEPSVADLTDPSAEEEIVFFG